MIPYELRRAYEPAGPGDYDLRQPSRPEMQSAGREIRRPSNALAQGIAETANALGMDPVDLATIISYETAGTFDPTKRGPTTQWGQHRGLIQWGEPQARQYGVSWDDPLGSQLGADGAIVRYFRDAGWQPGMGLLDAYSAVNAGRVGRYNASDANNGGAPGTVRDKVENQMHAHRRKAASLLGIDTEGYSLGVPRGNALAGDFGGMDYQVAGFEPMVPVDPVAMVEGSQRPQEARQQPQRTGATQLPLEAFQAPQNALAAPVPQYDTRAHNLARLMRQT